MIASAAQGNESGRQVVVLGLAATLTVVAVDDLMTGRLTLFFDLCFITLCLGLALLVRTEDFFLMCLVPPTLMLGVFVLLATTSPALVAEPDDGVVQAVVSGLAHHSTALVVGYGLALLTLELRRRQLSKRDGSPAPTLSTSG